MKNLFSLLLCACLLLSIGGCGTGEAAVSGTESASRADTDQSRQPEPGPEESASRPSGSVLVAFFSLAGERYEVGTIEKGNTEIVADMIAEATGADIFRIEATTAYPTTYEGLLEISRSETDTPPEIAGSVDRMEEYETVFLGYPIWWGDIPTIIRVFLSSYDFSGKTILPFCTHAGSGLSGTDRTLGELCPDSTIGQGLAVRGSTTQNTPDSTRESVMAWLSDLGF